MAPADDERFLRKAIAAARRGIKQGQAPFGACIAKGGKEVASAHNEVYTRCDITAHAEIVAIRKACRKLKTIRLSGCTMYATTEPCPMCFSACHWAGISRIVYGARIKDAANAGFNELRVRCEELARHERTPTRIAAGVLEAEAYLLFGEWTARKKAKPY